MTWGLNPVRRITTFMVCPCSAAIAGLQVALGNHNGTGYSINIFLSKSVQHIIFSIEKMPL
jgi:hypothetical protein